MRGRRRRSGLNYDVLIRYLLAAGLILAIGYSVLLTRKIAGLEAGLSRERERAESISGQADGCRQSWEEMSEELESFRAAMEESGDAVTQPEAPPSTEAETTETAAPQPERLDTLVGISAGTVLDPAQIDGGDLDLYFKTQTIDEDGIVYNRINGKSYRKNDHIQLSDLRYLKILHYNFSHQIQVGEMIVNKALAEDYQYIFKELYKAEYEIQSFRLIDDYWAESGGGEDSDWNSIDANNSSAFCYRAATGSGKLSNHALGRAIDINPQQNPYVSYKGGKASFAHDNAAGYISRDSGKDHVITHEDLCYKLFKERGFTWGGDWNTIKDYQHFEKK